MKLHNAINRTVLTFLFFTFSFALISFDTNGKQLPAGNSYIDFISNSGEGDLPDWALLSPEDGYEGVRTNEFYKYLKTLSAVPDRKDVIVAVIDSGFDIDHPDLKDNIWINEKEINGVENIDDDNNGYVDDFHGWNFLGDSKALPLEATREYFRLKRLNTPETDPYFIKVKETYEDKKDENTSTLTGISETLNEYVNAENVLKEKNITTDPKKLMEISTTLKGKYQDAASMILGIYMLYGTDKEDLTKLEKKYSAKVKVLFDSTYVSDEFSETLLEKNYGNNNVSENKEEHGTHVSGIIASQKTGQDPFAKIMCLRTVPNEGDERDKDIGNAIRYAVDNGADIINMSAGKYFSRFPEFVVDAIKYAEEKGVLFVISGGNEGVDISQIVTYPKKFTEENGSKKYFTNMIVVGASSWMKQWNIEKDPENLNSKYDLAAPFSNYSNEVIDIFAPGADINSTVPGAGYKKLSGTSMAAPVVSGVAAILKSYFPQLSAAQLKDVIVSSARQYEGLKVKLRRNPVKVLFSDLSKSGGVIDLINAYKKAGEVSGMPN
ncbi:MAG: S8 family serine peptidase [Ignavibacteria bacterium]|nr:S8 family serine peptidase [Ignavibacteria bacterium]